MSNFDNQRSTEELSAKINRLKNVSFPFRFENSNKKYHQIILLDNFGPRKRCQRSKYVYRLNGKF